jgi:hypothetical protein
VSLPGHTNSPFAWLEAIAPPVLVLSTAYVLKEQVLESIEQRHADEHAFQAARAEWQAATAEPEQHPQWSQFYANALRDALRKANSRRQEPLSRMTRDDWRIAVTREMQTDSWYVTVPPDEDVHVLHPLTGNEFIPSRNDNGHHPKVRGAVGSGDV